MTSATAGIIDCHLHVIDPQRFPITPGIGYTPRPDEAAPREALTAVHDSHGVTHAVLVQPSCYGYDNAAMLDAVAAYPGRFKAIAVVENDAPDRVLDALGERGVVGVRYNLATFDPDALTGTAATRQLARLKERGWFVQVHARDDQWAAVALILLQSGARVLIDHFGVGDPALGLDAPGFRAVLDLGRTGRATLKLSAPFRIASSHDRYAAIEAHVRALRGVFGTDRCLWGSDWPFLALPPGIDYGAALAALDRWFPDAESRDADPAPQSDKAVRFLKDHGHATARPLPSRDFLADPLRVAIAGAGEISHYHLIAWQKQPRTKIVAICDPATDRAKQRATAFAIAETYDGLERLLDSADIEAVDVASPRETHAALVDMAAARGIPVLCQKPLTPTLAEAEALAARTAGKIRLMVHENWRFRPWYRQVKAWLDGGDPGTILEADLAMHSSGLLPDASGRAPALVRQPFMADEEKLMIAEVLIHHLDVLRWLLGPLKLLDARTAYTLPDVRGETLAAIFLETADGAPVIAARLDGGARRPGAHRRPSGDRRRARQHPPRRHRAAPARPRAGEPELDFAAGYQASFDGGSVISSRPASRARRSRPMSATISRRCAWSRHAYAAAAARPVDRRGGRPMTARRRRPRPPRPSWTRRPCSSIST